MSEDISHLEMLERVIRRHGWPSDQFDIPSAMLDVAGIHADLVTRDDNRIEAYRWAVERLGVHEHAMLLALRDAFDGDARLQAAISANGDRKLFILGRLFSKHWRPAMDRAFAAWILQMHAERRLDVISGDVISTQSKSGWGGEAGFNERDILSDLEAKHVLGVVIEGDYVSPLMHGLCDAEFVLEVTSEHLSTALRHRFGLGDDVACSLSIAPALIDAQLLDLAIKRATSITEAKGYLTRLSEAAEKRMASDEIKAKSEAAPRKLAGSSKISVEILRPLKPAIADLSGYGSAAAWGQDLAEDIASYQAGGIGWEDVDAGCLLSGPPGTGKTLFASALAATCKLPFIATSFAAWQGVKGGHLGDIVNAIRGTFEAANNAAPCILFIDEIDAIPARGSSRNHDDYWVPIVTALLECLDGTSRREGLVVVGACNHPDRLDPALVRSGRLDRRFEIGLPDESALGGIFAHHLPDLSADVISPVATALAGSTSGADAARIAREARRIARREKREIADSDLMSIALPPDTRPEEVRWLAAVHEAGHAIALLSQGIVPGVLSVVTSGNFNGTVGAIIPANAGRLRDFDAQIIVSLAGRAAEEVILGHVSGGAGGGAGSDLEQATQLLAQTSSRMGLGNHLIYASEIDSGFIEHRLRRMYAEAVLLISRHRQSVLDLASLAMSKRVLGQPALRAFAIEKGFAQGERA